MLVKKFIEGPFLSEIRSMTFYEDKEGNIKTHAYLGFQLICLAIEFLGACLDQYDWSERNSSEKRFRLAIKELFDEKYEPYNKGGKIDLYSNLRCSMVHSARPGNNIGLSEVANKATHLSLNGNSLTLVFEYFLDDFENACKKVINLIDQRTIMHEKVYDHILFTPQDFLIPN